MSLNTANKLTIKQLDLYRHNQVRVDCKISSAKLLDISTVNYKKISPESWTLILTNPSSRNCDHVYAAKFKDIQLTLVEIGFYLFFSVQKY